MFLSTKPPQESFGGGNNSQNYPEEGSKSG